METAEVGSLIEDFGSSIDDLEESLEPILKAALATTTSKLPLLDKAKLYVLTTYAIESVLFSALRLNGVDAKNHPVFRELARVKEYFEKIKTAESGPNKRPAVLDKEAAARFVKQGLAGNDKYDQERMERTEREKASAKRKADALEQSSRWGSHNRFEGVAKRIKAQQSEGMVPVVKAGEAGDDSSEDEDQEDTQQGSEGITKEQTKTARKAAKQQRRAERSALAKGAPVSGSSSTGEHESSNSTTQPPLSQHKPGQHAPRGHHDTFQALLQGPIPKMDEKAKKKKKRKSRGEYRQQLEDERAKEML